MKVICLVLLVGGVASQAITPGAMKTIFKFADPKLRDTLTTGLNADKTIAAQKTRCANFAKTNLIGKGIKVTATDPLSKAAGATTKCNAFLDHRDGLKKYIDWQFGALSKDFVTPQKSAELKTLYWKVDKTANNNFTKVIQDFMAQGVKMLAPAKQPLIVPHVMKVQKDFSAKFPAVAKAVFTYKY